MTVTLPIINGSSGVWGNILNTAITDIDNRLMTATATNGTQDTNITGLQNRVTTLEGKPSTQGMLILAQSTNRPAPAVGQVVLETDTGFLYYVQTVSGTPTRLPWPGSLVAKLKQTAPQNIASGGATGTAVTFDTKDFDRLNGGNGTTRYTCQVPGTYEFTGGVSFAGNATNSRAVMWSINGTIQNSTRVALPAVPGGTNPTVLNARTVPLWLSVGQYVEMIGYQDSGATLATNVTTMNQPSMIVKYLGYFGN